MSPRASDSLIRVTWNLSRNRVPRNSLESVASSNLGFCRARKGPRNSVESVVWSSLGLCRTHTGLRNSLESVALSNLSHLRADVFWELVVQLRAVELVEICGQMIVPPTAGSYHRSPMECSIDLHSTLAQLALWTHLGSTGFPNIVATAYQSADGLHQLGAS